MGQKNVIFWEKCPTLLQKKENGVFLRQIILEILYKYIVFFQYLNSCDAKVIFIGYDQSGDIVDRGDYSSFLR